VSDLNSVNDIRNGMLVDQTIHHRIDTCEFAFLKVLCLRPMLCHIDLVFFLQTPNPVLDATDVANNPTRYLRDGTQYPSDERFTLQLLLEMPTPDRVQLERICMIGQDAAFKSGTNLPKPSALLLHYRYGASAVKLWGRHEHLLSSDHRKNIPRPPAEVTPYPAGPSLSINDRSTAIKKRECSDDAAGSSRRKGDETGGSTARDKERDQDDSSTSLVVIEPVDGSTGWDADDWMLFFMSNSKAAHERRRVEDEEASSRIKKWASGISVGQAC
jgi:hypothetical protein